MKSVKSFLKSVIDVGRTVSWPSRPEVVQSSFLVLVVAAISGLLFFAVDVAVQQAVMFLLGGSL